MDTWWHKRRKRGQQSADQSGKFLFKEGRVMAILRPKDPELKLASVARIKIGTPHEQAQPMFDELLNEQPHLFVGYAARGTGNILDAYGDVIDVIKPGDSFVGCGTGTQLTPPMFMRTGKFHHETWDGRVVVVLPDAELKADSNVGIVTGPPDSPDRGAVILRGGAKEVNCHIPTLNWMITGDKNKDYRSATTAA